MTEYRFGDICKVINGRAYRQPELLDTGKYPVLRVGNFFSSDRWFYSDLELPEDKYCDNGDLLFAWSASFGPRIWDGGKVIYHYHIWKLEPNEAIVDKYYLYYWLRKSVGILTAGTHGSVMAHMTKGDMENQRILLPRIEEQRKVGKTLRLLDDKIKINSKINDNLLKQMQLLYFNLLNSCECSQVRLEDVSQKIAMGPFGSNIKVSTFVPEGVPIISGNHLRSVFLEEPSYNYITEEHAQRLKNSIVYPRDIVFTHAGNIGQVAMIPEGCDFPYYMISQRQFYMRCDESKVIPEFVLFFFHSRDGKGKLLANANSTGVPSIAQPSSHLKNIEMPMPRKADQDEWYRVIKPMVNMYVTLCKENKRLSSLRDSLLPRLMSGEIDVSDIQI